MEFSLHYEPKTSVKSVHGPTTFEEAVEKTGFGKFNIILIISAICGIFAPIFETTTMSYVFAPAQCDLNLSLQDKGYLNSIVYGGMISTSFIWGFLIDTFGRRKLMIYGFLLNAFIGFITAFSQNVEMLMVGKFLGGVIINGPFTAMATYLSEFHSSEYRSKIQLVNGAFKSTGQIVLPLLAWGVLPLPVNWNFFSGLINFHSWNLYLVVISLFPLVSALIFFFLPESPKFLMTMGENDKAMEVFRKVYSMNSGKMPETYPVKELLQETAEQNKKRSIREALAEEFSHLGPLFRPPYLNKFLVIASMQFCLCTSLNSLRLWTPQLFQALEDYKLYNNGSTTDLCTMMDYLQPKEESGTCTINVGNPGVYVNSIIVASSAVVGFFFTISLINRLGQKTMMVILAVTAASSAWGLYFSQGTTMTTTFSTLFVACANICGNILLSIVVDLFPTTLRAFTMSLVMAIARMGALAGSIIFPFLVDMGCAPPFFVVGSIIAVGGLFTVLLPRTQKRAMV